MPRIIYKTNRYGKVPSVTTVINRFKDSGGLIHWAWKVGSEGKNYRTTSKQATDIGSIVHGLIEDEVPSMTLKGFQRKFQLSEEDSRQALNAFSAYLKWKETVSFRTTQKEVSLVSEKYGFGGTFDACQIDRTRSLLDYKTSKAIYEDYVIQLAAYGLLWEENFPQKKITGGYHILRLDKETGEYEHWRQVDLREAKEVFLLYLHAYRGLPSIKRLLKEGIQEPPPCPLPKSEPPKRQRRLRQPKN